MARPKIETPKDEGQRLKKLRLKASQQTKADSKKYTSDLSELETVAWLAGANRPFDEVMEAVHIAREAGYLWRQIGLARGGESPEHEGRVSSTLYRKWLKQKN